jgi:periplasmic protein TonB
MNTRVAQRHPMSALGRIGIVAGMHVAIVYLIATGLGIVKPMVVEPMQGDIIDEQVVKVDEVPTIPQPRLDEQITVQVEEPLVKIDTGEREGELTGERVEEVPPRREVLVAGPLLVGVRPDSRYPLTQPPYPPSMVRAGYEGSVDIEIYVLPSGRVGDARVVRSTGHPALDQSAIDEAKRRWRLLPATRDGEAYAQWHKMRVVFELKDR